MDYHELHKMTVAQLREIAKGIEGVTGYTQMRKDQLLKAICQHLNIEMHEHHEVVGVDKQTIKAKIRELKAQRAEALASGDAEQRRRTRRQIHHLKRKMRRAMV